MVSLNVLPTELLKDASGVLLVVSAAEESAKRIESHLRNAGHPLRTVWISDLTELEDALRRDTPDLLLCEDKLSAASLESMVRLRNKLRPELPMLALTKAPDAESTAAVMTEGLQDCVSSRKPADLRHLERVVMREIINHHHLRELRATRARLHDFQQRHQQLTEGTLDAVARVQEGILVDTNTAFVKLLGYEDAAALIGTPIIDLVMPEQQNRVKERLRQVLKGKHGGEPLELELRACSGRIKVKANLILGASDGESVIEMLVRHESAAAESGLKSVSARGEFALALGAPAPEGQLRAALLVKLDHYAELEKRIGMIDAEEIRDRVSEAIRAKLEPQDGLFIFSTDELALLISRPDIDGIEALAQTLRGDISKQVYATRSHEAQVMLSAAIYPMGSEEQTAAIVQQLASEVRRLSLEGGDRVCVLGDAAKVKVAAREQARIAAAVKLAMEQNRFKLAYQPIASLEGETEDRLNVLVRMVDETGSELHAGEFLPHAQSAGLMTEIDRWVIGRTLTAINARGPERILFVKLSEDSVRDAENFLAWLKVQLQQRAAPTHSLVFELQELTAQNHVRKAKALTQALSNLGFGIALERYGLGASSVALLNHIPAQYLKFHPDFTNKFNDKGIQRKLTELMAAARQHHLKTVVAHIEDPGVMARMWQMGVNFVQGLHMQEPEVVLLSGEIKRHRDG